VPLPANFQHFHPQIVADPSGILGCAFYEFGPKPTTQLIDVIMAQSFDGGASFSYLTVTDQPWDPTVDAPWTHGDSSVTFIGDYMGLDASARGFYPLWTDTRTGIQELWTDIVPGRPRLQVDYDPRPIPWKIPRDVHGKQSGPGTADITLTVTALDSDTGAPVPGIAASFQLPDPGGLIDDPNHLNFTTNEPHAVALMQVTSHEVPVGHPPLYFTPSVKVTAGDYDDKFLDLA
jgi:hypothetical protein